MDFSELLHSFTFALKQTTLIEWFIFITALAYVFLAAIENSWCWLFGIIASALSIYLCYSGKLFLESGLNVFYVIIGVYGWYQWKYGSKEKAALKIIPSTINKNILLMGIGMALWIPFALVAKNYSTQALPYLDAFITAFSLVATWMTAKKILENWLYWIVIDALAVVLYANRGFYLIALLYIIYTILALVGYIKWKKTITT